MPQSKIPYVAKEPRTIYTIAYEKSQLLERHAPEFQRVFGCRLHSYWNLVT